jgi:N-acetylmuramoyl-L-alanine amidase
MIFDFTKGFSRILCITVIILLLSNVMVEVSASSKKIAIDPGHGGTDPGAVGPTGLKEKDVNLQIALKLKAKLEAQGHTVVMTRDKDETVSLEDRVKKANEANADIFVSTHCNAAENPNAKGTETYRYPGSLKGKKLATEVQKELVNALETDDRGVKEGTYYVLKHTKMPAILAEVAFISNPGEEEMLKTDETREKAAQAMKKGIDTYFSTVGGVVFSVDKLGLLAPYIGLASTIIVAAVAAAIYVRQRNEKE